jgi:hypothetical protein
MGIAVFSLVLMGLFIATQPSLCLPGKDKRITIEASILITPAIQSKMLGGGTLEDGRVYGVLIGGNVTMNFPEEIIVLEAPSDREDQEFVRLIKDRISSYPCSCGDFIQIDPWKRFFVTSYSSTMAQKVYEIHDKIQGRGEYWLHFAIDTDLQVVYLNFLCEAILYDSLKFDRSGRISREELFDRTIPLIRDQALLVGFTPPKPKYGYRCSALWFVVRELNGLDKRSDFK